MSDRNNKSVWYGKISHHLQLGGIETSVLDNGPGRNVRIAWINTGTGLRYKVAIDRAMDIIDAFFNQHSLAWLSCNGITQPQPDYSHGIEWLSNFPGGLLTTCGLSHTGGPESDEFGKRGQHGKISNIPATLESIVQPDIVAGNLNMSITGIAKESKVFGPNLEIRRTIASTLGSSEIRISDKVTNRGNTSVPHMILYHCNFGWPLIDDKTKIIWKGVCQSRGLEMDNEIFNDKQNYKLCRNPMKSHNAGGESCGFIDVKADKKGMCKIGLYNSKLNLAVAMEYNKKQLPCLTNWQHWGLGEYVCALEPGTNPPIGQKKARELDQLIYLEPGECRKYELKISVLTKQKQIKEFTSIG
ncbi:MAG: aldose 1-epimerase family protein [Phycisphaerales bacterium]